MYLILQSSVSQRELLYLRYIIISRMTNSVWGMVSYTGHAGWEATHRTDNQEKETDIQ